MSMQPVSVREMLLCPVTTQTVRDPLNLHRDRYLVALANQLYAEDRFDVALPVELSIVLCLARRAVLDGLIHAQFLSETEAGIEITPEGRGLIFMLGTRHDMGESYIEALARRYKLIIHPEEHHRERPLSVIPLPLPAPMLIGTTPAVKTINITPEVAPHLQFLTELAEVIRLNRGQPVSATLTHRLIQWDHQNTEGDRQPLKPSVRRRELVQLGLIYSQRSLRFLHQRVFLTPFAKELVQAVRLKPRLPAQLAQQWFRQHPN